MQGFSTEEFARADAALAQLDASAMRHALQVQGRAMVWREWGSGPALVLIHGGHGSWEHWARNIDVLARQFRVLVPDLPGFGDSADFDCPPHDPDRLELLLCSLEQSIEQLVGASPLYLAGFSFGGAISGMLAPRLPRLQRLALLGSAGHGGPRREREPLSNWRAFTGEQRQQALLQNLGAFMLSCAQAADALALRIHTRACEATRFRSKAISRKQVVPQALKAFDKPVLMVWGDADVTAVPAMAAEALGQGDPQKVLRIVNGAGHWVQYERADEINALLADWFTRP